MDRHSVRPIIWCLLAIMFMLALFGFRWDRAYHNGGPVASSVNNGKIVEKLIPLAPLS